MRNTFLVAVAAAVLLVGGSLWTREIQARPGVVSMNGLHWHPQLEIFVRGEKIEIPQNIGLGAVHRPVHTHEDPPIIHLEFSSIVREEDIMLGAFFESWGRDMRSFGENMRMTVNGVDNTEYEGYIMKDKDQITLHYD